MSEQQIIAPDRGFSFSNENGFLTERAHTWMVDMTSRMNEGQNLSTIEGTGSPEGVESAIKDRRYRDTVTDDIYLKTTATGDTGWILV